MILSEKNVNSDFYDMAYPKIRGVSRNLSRGRGISLKGPPGICPGEGGPVSIAPPSNVLNKNHIPEDIDK